MDRNQAFRGGTGGFVGVGGWGGCKGKGKSLLKSQEEKKLMCVPLAGYYTAQNDYTHIFIIWELIS